MADKVTFDGPNKLIVINDDVTEIDVEQDLYSDWKEFMLIGSNSKFLPAFRTTGGDAIGTGLEVGAYFFLQNDDGWRIRPPEQDTEITFTGNLYPEDAGTAMIVPTTGSSTVLMTIERSSLTQAEITNPEDVWNFKSVDNSSGSLEMLTAIERRLKMGRGRL